MVATLSRRSNLLLSSQLWTIKNSECSGSFDLHEAKIWALETASDGSRVVTGAADGRILFLDDVTELEEIEQAGRRDEKILQDQSLANCLHEKVACCKTKDNGTCAIVVVNKVMIFYFNVPSRDEFVLVRQLYRVMEYFCVEISRRNVSFAGENNWRFCCL